MLEIMISSRMKWSHPIHRRTVSPGPTVRSLVALSAPSRRGVERGIVRRSPRPLVGRAVSTNSRFIDDRMARARPAPRSSDHRAADRRGEEQPRTLLRLDSTSASSGARQPRSMAATTRDSFPTLAQLSRAGPGVVIYRIDNYILIISSFFITCAAATCRSIN